MARVVTLGQMRARARFLANVVGDTTVLDPDLNDLANRHLTEVYDALVDAGPPEYFAATSTFNTAGGTSTYALPADFRTLLEVYTTESSTELRLVHPVRNGERGTFRIPTGTWAMTLEYIPAPPTLVNDSDTFDGVSGWEELITNLMARDVMVARQDDASVVLNSIGALQGRILTRSRNRDRGHSKYVSDMDAQGSAFPWSSTTQSRICAYRLRAGNIELYEALNGLPP